MEELEKIAEELQRENDKRAAADPMVRTSLETVVAFLKSHRVMCYGGTAINNLLPPDEQFYDPEYDIADYDFFSKTPQEHAMILANKLDEIGIKNIEVRPGIHLGTFKVFADFEGVADITHMDDDLFDRLWDQSIEQGGIHYVPPDYLRMSMYLELSRPRGDVSRWAKVYKRLLLLNKHHPITCEQDEAVTKSKVTPALKKKIVKLLKTQPVVLLGVTAAEHHMRQEWTTPIMLLADKATIEKLTKDKEVRINEGTEVLPPRYNVMEEDGSSHIRFYETTACHSFHTTQDGVRVASIPTILQFFFAYIYAPATKGNIASIQCIAQRLVDIAHTKPKRRYDLLTPKDCLGKQETLVDMRKHKAVLYEKVSTNKGSADFLRYFFTYNPRMSKTERTTLRNRLRRTRRARSTPGTSE